MLRWFTLNIDGDRIAGWECPFQRLIEQFVEMRHRGSKGLVQTFCGTHHICGLFAFVWVAPTTRPETLFPRNEQRTQIA